MTGRACGSFERRGDRARDGDLETVEDPGDTERDDQPGVEARPGQSVDPRGDRASDDAPASRAVRGGRGHAAPPSVAALVAHVKGGVHALAVNQRDVFKPAESWNVYPDDTWLLHQALIEPGDVLVVGASIRNRTRRRTDAAVAARRRDRLRAMCMRRGAGAGLQAALVVRRSPRRRVKTHVSFAAAERSRRCIGQRHRARRHRRPARSRHVACRLTPPG